MIATAIGFSDAGAEVRLPYLHLRVRNGRRPHLEITLEVHGSLFVAPESLLWRTGSADLAVGPMRGFARASGHGVLALGQDAPGTIVLLRLPAGTSAVLAPGSLLATTSTPDAALVLGGHGERLLAVAAPAHTPVLLALRARGRFSLHTLAAAEALDIAVGTLLIADAQVDLARGEHLVSRRRRSDELAGNTAEASLAFIECVGAGSVGLQTGRPENPRL